MNTTRDAITISEVLIARTTWKCFEHYGAMGLAALLHPSTQLILISGPDNRITVIKG